MVSPLDSVVQIKCGHTLYCQNWHINSWLSMLITVPIDSRKEEKFKMTEKILVPSMKQMVTQVNACLWLKWRAIPKLWEQIFQNQNIRYKYIIFHLKTVEESSLRMKKTNKIVFQSCEMKWTKSKSCSLNLFHSTSYSMLYKNNQYFV